MDYEVQRPTRHCATTGRELAPGETFFSVLSAEGAKIVRSDFCAEAWSGPPPEALGWWKSQLPAADAKKKPQWAPNDVMLHLFDELSEQPHRADMQYVLTLLLIRRRVLRLEENEAADASAGETLLVYCPRRQTEYRVPVAPPDAARVVEIQQDLAKLLLSEAA